jgi:CMP-2-keto-3-deoxyoctulosonic acid synthetase
MLDEAKAMVRVSKHDHIVNIQGNFKVIDPKLYKRMLNPKEPGLLEKQFFSEK